MSERKILDLAKPILKTWPSESHLEAMILQQEKGIYRAGEEEMQQYDMLYKSAERVLSLLLKYMMVGKKEILQKMKGILAGMKTQEAVLLSELLSKL